MSSNKFGTWHAGIPSDAIVTDKEHSADPECDPETVAHYGGHVVAESVAPRFKPLIIAAPDLLAALEAMLDAQSIRLHPLGAPDEGIATACGEAASKARAAIAKAKGESA